MQKKEGLSLSEIARRLARSKSTISLELARNSGCRGYFADPAEAGARRQAVSAVPRKLTDRIWELIVSKLRLQWSPEQIAGWLKLMGIVAISFQWIYRRIRAYRAGGGSLYLNLRGRGRSRADPGPRRYLRAARGGR